MENSKKKTDKETSEIKVNECNTSTQKSWQTKMIALLRIGKSKITIFSIGVWLFFSFLFFIWTVVGTLSAYGFQDKIPKVKEQNQSINLATIIEASNELNQIHDRQSTFKSSFFSYLIEVEELKNDNSLQKQDREEKMDSIENKFIRLKSYRAQLDEEKKGILAQKSKEELLLISELKYMHNFYFHIFAIMPSQLLTLILTIAMGALGSWLYLALNYFRGDSTRPFSWYFMRPMLGMATALAVFILAKAGQLTISDAGSQSIYENLNPFFISFLGIISGLMSEQATTRIKAAGKAIFRAQDYKARWLTVDIQKMMEESGKTTQQLALLVNFPKETVDTWLENQQVVPIDAQKIIAAWLDMPPHTLFTDIKPIKSEKTYTLN